MSQWTTIPSDQVINQTMEALRNNGFTVEVVENAVAAKEAALKLIPEKSEVMTMTSVTLDTIGLTQEINESGKYDGAKNKLYGKDQENTGRWKEKLGAAPEYVIGSVHGLTQDGKVIVASNTGSQLPAYTYGSDHVIWVVGAQKITENLEQALTRLDEHTLPLESERARQAYGVEGSFVSKLVIFNREVKPGRVTIIIVKEALGY